MNGVFRKWIVGALAALCILIILPDAGAAAEPAGGGRFNVVVVLDGSGSMRSTDPDGLRFEAVRRFTGLLTERGNVLGGLVFSDGVDASQDPFPADGQESKDRLTTMLSSVYTNGNTNTGLALSEAVSMLRSGGDPDLPSVILFLSDGNTYMEDEEGLKSSLDLKAEAISQAMDPDFPIPVYSVCLNADGKADVEEFRQISDATGGAFVEVRQAADLQKACNMFYTLLNGAPFTEEDIIVPEDGRLTTNFDVPNFGVEEVNISIYGKCTGISLLSPDGAQVPASQMDSETFTLLKLTTIIPGQWTLAAEGDPGSTVRIDMVFNPNLSVEASTSLEGDALDAGEELTVRAVLSSGSQRASTDEDYEGYSASLIITNGYREQLQEVEMALENGAFVYRLRPEEGVYHYQVHVSGNLEKDSQVIGPVAVVKPAPPAPSESQAPAPPVNTPPEPVQERVESKVFLIPFMDAGYTLDLTTLARDAEDSQLRYTVRSSSLIEGTDYTVEDGVLVVDHFSLSKGVFSIRATDTGGLYCDVEVVVRTVNVGLLTLIGLGIAGLAALAVLGVGAYILLNKPFRGTIHVRSIVNGAARGTDRTPRRGRCKLSAFELDPLGLDYNRCYFQATGERHIQLVTNVPVIWNHQKTNKVHVQSGVNVEVYVQEGDSRRLSIRFTSRMPPRRPAGPSRAGGPRRPSTPGRTGRPAAPKRPPVRR